MVLVHYQGKSYPLKAQQSVLDGLLEQGVDVPHLCKSGLCQRCLMIAEQGKVPENSQRGLSIAKKQQAKFLPCLCYPKEDLSIKSCHDVPKSFAGRVIEKRLLSRSVLLIKMQCQADYPFFYAGQFIFLTNASGVTRSYSIASLHDEEMLIELHIKYFENGAMSGWIFNSLQEGENVTISEPLGDCYYTGNAHSQPILLIGTGTGLAPLLGILRDALSKNHSSPIHLIHGGKDRQSLYAFDLIQELIADYPNLSFHPCVMQAENVDNEVNVTDISDYLDKHFPNLENWQVYVCGEANFVQRTKEQVFLLGASFGDIYSDAFIPLPQK